MAFLPVFLCDISGKLKNISKKGGLAKMLTHILLSYEI